MVILNYPISRDINAKINAFYCEVNVTLYEIDRYL